MLNGKSDESKTWVTSTVSPVSWRRGIFLVLTLVLLTQSGWGQRIGPLVLEKQQRSKAAAVRPPSLQLSLPSPATAVLPPLGPDDLQRVQPQQGRPPVIGIHRQLPPGVVTLSLSGETVMTTARGAWQSTAAGRVWRLKVTSPSARAMRIHFKDFAIGAGSLWLHSASGQIVGPYRGSGLYGDGDFWSGIVFGDSLTIEYLPHEEAATEAVPFQIVAISHIWDDAFGADMETASESPDRRELEKLLLAGPIEVAVGTRSKPSWLDKSIQSVKRSTSLQSPRPKAARRLTPGRPVKIQIDPVDNPSLFNGDSSFRLEVPEDASRVTFTLESADPDVDVDLYVRYGEDNDLQDGRVVYDYVSRGDTGNEEIIITPESDPPLQAGPYFVSLVLYDTGVAAECTLTAEVELDEEDPEPTSGRPLRPGRPVDFSLGPVDSPRLFNGDSSFRLEVPRAATRVTLTLESEANVRLYVRYRRDNRWEDERIVYDYNSRGDTGNEEIVITPESDPPLRAGTYFVSVLLIDRGVVAECTLTAEVEPNGGDPEPTRGGPLTPGEPAEFRLGPVDSPTLFAGNDSFRLEVPEDATLVTFTLESVDPDVDVVLFVRYGEDNGVQDGRVVFDHGSRNPTGDERIGITRRSDPPLRAGTYFVSVALRDTGLVAEGTITATVETDAVDCHLDVTCHSEWSSSASGVAQIFVETSEGTSRTCSGTVLNNSRQDFTPFFLTAAHCVPTEEEARSVTAAWLYQTRTCNGEPPDLRSIPRTEGARLLSTTGHSELGDRNGDLTLLRLEGDLPDGVMFQGWVADPQPVGAQVTGIHHPGSDWGEFKRISFGEAIPDPGFGVSDETYLYVSYPLGQGYTQPGSSGSAIFSSPGTVIGALSGGEGGYACPTGPSRDIYTRFSAFYPQIRQFIDEEFALEFAHFANGSSISSDVVLLNVATTPIRPTLYFADKDGNRIDAESVVQITRDLEVLEDGALSVRTEMAPLGELTISTHGRGDLVVGSARVISDGPIGGVLRFDAPGIGVAGVGASERLNDALFPARRQAGGINTGVALRNLEAQEVTVSCYLMRRGSVLEDADIPLDAHGQTARFINEIFPGTNTSNFVGSVRCTAPDGGRFAGVALEMDPDNGIFTTLPVVPVDQTGAGIGETTLEFAHFANGSSITSDVVLLNVSTMRVRPTLYFFDQDGNEIVADSVVEISNSLEVRGDGGLRVRAALPPLGELTISTHGRGDTVVGSVRVISDGPIGGVLRFSLPGAGVAGVGASEPVADALFPARRQAGGINTGVALRNLEAQELTVSCYLMRGGSVLEQVDIQLEASGQTARFINEIFVGAGTSNFVGSVRCLAPDGGRFAGIALEMDFDNGIFTTLPVVPVKGGTRPEAPQVRPTVSLSASPISIERGQSATLRWSSTNATSASITPGIGTVPTSGSRRVSPTGTTTYRITVRGADGQMASASTTVTVTEPPASLAPADQDAFNEVVVGMRILTDDPNNYADFISPGRFKETEGSDEYTGSYTYRNTGSNTGTVTFNYDDGDRCTTHLTFASAMAGTATFTCNDGSSGAYNWDLVEIPAAGAPDLVIQTPSVSDSSPNAGESFTLSATVRNQGNGRSASTTLRYYRSTDATISTSDTQVGTDVVGALSPQAASAETMRLTAPTAAGTYYYGACVDPVSGESNSRNNCSISQSVTVVTEFPDLVVESPSVSDNAPASGDSFEFTASVRNQGNGRSASTTLRYYRSTDATISAGDTAVGTDSVGFLDASRTSNESVRLTAPSSPGTYYYGACVDAVSDESDTGNNCSSAVEVTVGAAPAPDLVVESPTVSDSSPAAGNSFDLSATVRNQGTGRSRSFTTLRYYRSTDATISARDTEVGTDSVGFLDASETSDESVRLTAPSSPGTYYYGACVDTVSNESDTENNCSSGVAVTVGAAPAPDLVVESPTVSDSSPAAGNSFDLSATVRNQGTARSRSFTTLRYYRSTDATISARDTAVGTDSVGFLDASETSDESVRLTAPSSPGTYYYGACVDTVSNESDTENNCSSGVAVTVGAAPAPDLVVESPAVSDNTPASGETFTLSATVRNQGPGDATESVYLHYYSSADATIETNDTEVGSRDYVGFLDASETSDESIRLTAPSSPGTYYYGACVETVPDESDTGNNCSSAVEVTVGAAPAPDLVVDSPTVSDSSPAAGNSFDLSATVRNQGTGRSRSFTTLRYYRSTDATISARDTEVGTDSVGFLDASETSDESIRLTAPSSPGTYYYGACVQTVPDESDTGNNCSSAVEVTVGAAPAPDLVVESPAVSNSSPAVGQSFTLSATVRNQGAGDATSSAYLHYYRSADATIGTSDTEVGSRDYVGYLDASETSDESIRLTAPSSPGTYYYGACVETVPDESDTGNNCSSAVEVTVRPAPPSDLVVESPAVSNSSPAVGQSFTLSATVRNQGAGDATSSAYLHYYRSADATIGTSDTEVGSRDYVGYLDASETSDESIRLTAPSSPGTYYYGACVDAVSNESDTGNNCSRSVHVAVVAAADLVVGSPAVSDSTPETGQSFDLGATVRNQGDARSPSTTLRYYRSINTIISSSDREVGTDDVASLAADGTSDESTRLTLPDGCYFCGACVDPVDNEAARSNNCSKAVKVVVGGPFLSFDLDISRIILHYPVVGIIGEAITMTVDVTNRGPGTSRQAKLKFSNGSSLDIPALDPNDTVTYARHRVGSIQFGTTRYTACIEAPCDVTQDNNCESRSVTYTP